MKKKEKAIILKPDPRNPNRMSDDDKGRMARSLAAFGDLSGIVINKRTGLLVGGHQRCDVLRDGKQEIEWLVRAEQDGTVGRGHILHLGRKYAVRVVDWPEAKARAAMLAANRFGRVGEDDGQLLKDLLEELDDGQTDMNLTGYTEEAIEALMNQVHQDGEGDAEPQMDRAEELQKKWGTATGDLWLLGNHRLLVGDSTKAEDVARVFAGPGGADMVFTDPPYNVAVNVGEIADLKARHRRTDGAVIGNDAMKPDDFRAFLLRTFRVMFDTVKPGGAVYVCHAEGLGMEVLFRSTFAEAGFKPAEIIVWVKDVFVFGRQDYHWRHEPIIYGWREGAAHYFVNDRTQDTVWNFPRPKASENHPTMKPVEIPARAISNSSRINEVVFDGFLGSGTTMVAAQNLGRKCYGLEVSAPYCSVILQRMQDAFPDIDIRRGEP